MTARRLLFLSSVTVVAFLWAPIAVLVVLSFNAGRNAAIWEGPSISWYGTLLRDAPLLASVARSAIVAAVSTLCSTILGTMAALALARHPFRAKGATTAALYLPILVPEVVVGAALLSFFAALSLRLSLLTVLSAHVVFSVSYVTFVVRARLAGLDPSLADAARDLGAGPFDAFRRVTLPLIAPGVLSGALLAFTVSLDDYVITSFVAGPGSTTLPVHIAGMLKVGVTPEVNAVSTLLLAATIVLILGARRTMRGDA
ncbi:MAG: ABC transporter permease [Acidobacteriota bacterium]